MNSIPTQGQKHDFRQNIWLGSISSCLHGVSDPVFSSLIAPDQCVYNEEDAVYKPLVRFEVARAGLQLQSTTMGIFSSYGRLSCVAFNFLGFFVTYFLAQRFTNTTGIPFSELIRAQVLCGMTLVHVSRVGLWAFYISHIDISVGEAVGMSVSSFLSSQ